MLNNSPSVKFSFTINFTAIKMATSRNHKTWICMHFFKETDALLLQNIHLDYNYPVMA